MQTTYISTAALRLAPRIDLQRQQSELADRSFEVATSRHADPGLELGLITGRTVAARVDFGLLDALMISNKTAIARMDVAQQALEDIEATNTEMLGALVALPSGDTGATAITIQAEAALERVADLGNGASDGSYLFAGTNSDTPPIVRFDNGPRAVVEAAFNAHFGFPVGDPLAFNITAADMTTFLQTDFANLFGDPDWGTNWSTASDTDMLNRVAPDERVTTSVNATEDAFRDTMRGLAMIAGLDLSALNDAARQSVVDEARSAMGDAVSGTVALSTRLGFAQQAVQRADDRISLARDLLEQDVATFEGVDPAEAKVRIDLLTTQIEMSYALTAQIARLSILNYA